MAGSRLHGGPVASVKQFQVTFDCAEPDRAEVLIVALVTIAPVLVCGSIAVWLLPDAGAAWLGAVAGPPVAMLPASIGTVILRWHRRRAASSDRTPHE
jgi:hypothetical protein